ncbi:MAG: hypothetical protein GAK45_01305 [Pseudomonas citronellolis]|nr:MAG: hypothetical protein GAK45_01305 [Pseudomonas citronellolis]
MQVFLAVEGHGAAADDGQVLSAVELGDLVGLVAAAEQGEVSAGGDLAAQRSYIGDFVALGFLGAETALFLHVVQRVIAVVGSKQFKLVARHQVGLVAGSDLARGQAEVFARADQDVAAGGDFGGLLANVVFLGGDLLATALVLGVAVFFVGGGGEDDVAPGAHGDVAGGVDAAGDGAEVAAGVQLQVAADLHIAAVLGDAGDVAGDATALEVEAVDLLHGFQAQVTPGGEAGIAAGLEDAAGADQVAPGGDVQVAAGFDTGGVVGDFLVDAVGVVAGVERGDAALVDDVAGLRGEADVATADDAASRVADAVDGQQVEALAGFDQAAVVDVGGAGGEIAAGAQGALAGQVATADQGQVVAQDQGAVGRQAAIGLGEVEHRDEDLLAIYFGFFEPDDVVGQRGDLFGGEAYAQLQLEAVLVGDGVVHQVLEQGFVAGHAVDVALAGVGDHRLLDQALLVEAVAQALLCLVRVVAKQAEQVVGAEEALEAGEFRIGLDQVLVAVARCGAGQALHTRDVVASAATLAAEAEQAVLPLRQAEAWQGDGVDLLLGEVRRQLRGDRQLDGGSAVGNADVARTDGLRPGMALHHAVVEALTGIDPHITSGLDHGGSGRGTRYRDFGGRDVEETTRIAGGFEDLLASQAAGVVVRRVRVVVAVVQVLVGAEGPVFAVVTGVELGVVVAFDAASGTLVAEGGRLDVDVSTRADAAVQVVEGAATEAEVTASGDRRLGCVLEDDVLGTLLGEEVDFAALAVADVVVLELDAAGDDALADLEIVGAAVVEILHQQGHGAGAFEAAGDVLHAARPTVLIVGGDMQGAQAVEVGVAVGEVLRAQLHVAAAEDQAVFVKQVARAQVQVTGAAEGATVVEAGSADAQVIGGGQAAIVVEGAARTDGGDGATAGDAPGLADADVAGTQVEPAQAAQAAVGGVVTVQVEVQGAVAGDQAIVRPVAAAADEALRGQQLAVVPLSELPDVEVEHTRLDDGVVGPTGGLVGEAAIGGEVAASQAGLGQVDAEVATAHMQHGAGAVLQGASLQVEVLCRALDTAAVVVEQTRGADLGGAVLAQRTNGAYHVIDAGRAEGQVAAAFDQAVLVVQCAAEAGVEVAGTDLATLGRLVAAIEQLLAAQVKQAAGVEAAAAVVDAARGGNVEGLGLGGAGVVAEGAGDQLEAAVGGVDGTAAAVVEVAAAQVEQAVLADDMTALVAEGAGSLEGGVALALQGAGAVVDAAGAGAGAELAGLGEDQAVLAVEQFAGQGQGQVGSRSHGAADAVVEIAGEDLEQVLAGELAAVVLQAAEGQLERAATGDFRAAAVVEQRTGEAQAQGALAAQGAAAIVEATGVKANAGGADLAATVVDGLRAAGQAALGAEQAGGAVVQVADEGQAEVTLGGDDAACIIEAAGIEAELALADQRAFSVVVEGAAERQGQRAIAARKRAAAAVVQAGGVDHQSLPTGEQALVGIEQGVGVQVELAGADEAALGAVVEGAAGIDLEIAAGNRAAAVAQVLRGDGDVALSVAAVVRVDPGFDDTAVADLRCAQCHALAGGQALAVVQLAVGAQLHCAGRVGRAIEGDVTGLGA